MRDLLDASSQRLIKIVEILAFYDDWITISDVASAIGVSERTVSNDISLLRKRWGQDLNIEVSVRNGIRMHHQNIALMGKMFTELFNESISLQWLEMLLFHPNNRLSFYEDELFVSSSTLNRLRPKINRVLAERGIFVQLKNNTYGITSDNEQYLRQFFTGFFNEIYGQNLFPFNTVFDYSVIESIVRKMLAQDLIGPEISVVIDELSVSYFKLFYMISLIRENQGFTVKSSHSISGEINNADLTYITGLFPKITEMNIRPIHEFILNQYNGWESREEKALVERESAAFSDRLYAFVHSNLDDNTRQALCKKLVYLYLDAKYRPYATAVLFDRISYFALSIKNNNVYLYEFLVKNVTIFSENIQFDMSEKIPDIVYWMCMLCPELGKQTPAKTVLIISDFNTQHACFLARYLLSIFNQGQPPTVSVTTTCLRDADNTELDQYDVIITTMPDSTLSHQNIIQINDYPSIDDLSGIIKALSQKNNPHLKTEI